MAKQVDFKFQIETMEKQAEEILVQRQKISTKMEDIRVAVEGIKTNWVCEESEQYQQKFTTTKDDVEKILLLVDAYAKALNEVAATYRTTDTNIRNKIESLPTDLKL